MKPASFEYERASTVAGAVARLAAHGPGAKLIAGGQSLVPMMAMRLSRPTLLVDIRELAELQEIRIEAETARVGACVRQCEALEHAALAQAVPLLAKSLRWVGHVQTRNRGTVGGSVVHADPCAELPLVVRVLEAQLEACDASGTSTIAAHNFFTGPLSTALAPEACLAAIHFPRWNVAEGALGCAFEEISIRHGDFALVAAGAQLALDAGGRCTRVVMGVGGAGPTPLALERAAAGLVGTRLEDAAIEAAAKQASRDVEPGDDQHASAEYRRHLARVLSVRVLRSARAEAHGRSQPGASP